MTHTPALDRSECEIVVRRLWPYLDGRVSEDDRERVVTHLAECEECRSHFDYAEAFLTAVRRTRAPLDEERLRGLVLACLSDEGRAANA